MSSRTFRSCALRGASLLMTAPLTCYGRDRNLTTIIQVKRETRWSTSGKRTMNVGRLDDSR